MPEAERRTAKGKAAVATCKQCARYLDPLFKLCQKKVCTTCSTLLHVLSNIV
jgi:pre-mRNA-splicing factor 18